MLSDDRNFAVELLLPFVVLSSDRNSVVSEKYKPAIKKYVLSRKLISGLANNASLSCKTI